MKNQHRTATALAALTLAALCAGGARAAEGDRIIGVSFAAGAPTGAEATILLRPLSFLRFEAGITTDVVAPGFHAGLALAVPWYISPVLNLEVGHQYGGDFNKIVTVVGGSASTNLLLRDVSYSYGSAHVGLELGFPNHFMIFAHAGYSVVRTETSGLGAYLAADHKDLGLTATREGRMQLIAPSAKAGIMFWIF
jgi:opacity protein-like surface antigen